MIKTRLILETPRLFLRELSWADLDFVAAMVGHREVMWAWGKAFTRDEAVKWITRQEERYAQDGYGYWLAVNKNTGEPVGQAGLLGVEIDGQKEVGLGYILHRPFWGLGYATEAAGACKIHALETLDAARVVAMIRPENEASKRVALKLGMEPERTFLFHGFDHVMFTVYRRAFQEGRH